ncbi:MAG: ABC transporter substrate-binding protein [Lachnospiraceae bacterium]|nr:ABC transporter substrate-binding protein [Lachnospiraceae bacterium]
MNRKIISATLAVCLSALLFAGCGSAGSKAGANAAKPTQDRSGNAITIPDKVEKIVSMAPSVTEILVDLGYADRIVACDTYSGFSPFAASLTPDIPQFDMMAPDNEAIVALSPDIVFTTGMSYAEGEDVYSAVKSAGICVADIPSSASIDDIKADMTFIADAVGAGDKVRDITAKMDTFIADVKKVAGGISDKKSVMYVMSVPTPDYPDVYTCGKGTYMDEVFSLIGAQNIAGDIDYQWPALSEEDILAKNPDVIIVGDTYTPDAVNAILSIDAWKDITAVKDGAVYSIDGDAFNQPNQYVMNSAYEIASYIYPDAYSGVEKPFK